MTERLSNQIIEQIDHDHDGLQAIGELAGHGRIRITELTLGGENAMCVQMTDQQKVDMGSMPGVTLPVEEWAIKDRHLEERVRLKAVEEKQAKHAAHAARVRVDRAIALDNRKKRRGW